MRRLAAGVVLVAVALTGTAACSKKSSTSTPQAVTTTTAPADQTKEVCTAAQAESVAAAAFYTSQFDAAIAQMAAGKDVDSQAILTTVYQRLTDWQNKLTEWSTKAVKPEVKTVLTDAIATVTKLRNPDDTTPLKEAKRQLAEIGTKLATACA